ncbi:MAG: hypothetical protein U1C33_00110, partial [Candidatus Cloacimonadaceae bacterium]|nr:hypothetical protein [Candidatus Cloacimonadaceae bacterium]
MKGTLHHIEIYVDDLPGTIDFWGWFLAEMGYSVYQEWDMGISYILGDTYLVFVQTEERFQGNVYHRCHSGLNHLAFHGGSREFIDEMYLKLKAKGISILYEDRYPHAGGG